MATYRKVSFLFAICIFAHFAQAEVFNVNSELHENVLLCNGSEPYQVTTDVYLDRLTFGDPVSIEELVGTLLRFDVATKQAALEYKFPEDLRKSAASVYRMRVAEYIAASSFAHMAKCAAEYYEDGDEIYAFSNTMIAPSTQEGFVMVRSDVVRLRIVTAAMYVD